ncbi:MAG: response regulator transcription factor [Nitriliruptorales bacterium]|nr:response regulator transcription factor [Nitriliruptorales bacterium]
MSIRVVLAEDSYFVREGVRLLFDVADEIELVASVSDYPALLGAVEEHDPDVVLTDIRMPPTHTDEGIQAARTLRESHPGIGVLVLSQYVDPDYALRLFEDGTQGRGYLLKERVSDVEQVVRAIQDVNGGGSAIDPQVVDALVEARSKGPSPLDELTPRESEVLEHLAQGKTNAGIAEDLVLSERAIEKHINNIFSKLGLTPESETNRRVRAVLMYLSEGGG